MNNGQMAEDVELAVKGAAAVARYNWYGGAVPTAAELVERVREDHHD